MTLNTVPAKKVHWPEIQNNVQVRHPKFGLGKVLLRIGEDENSKVFVRFQEEGEKKLALRYAKLVRDQVEEEPAKGPGNPGEDEE